MKRFLKIISITIIVCLLVVTAYFTFWYQIGKNVKQAYKRDQLVHLYEALKMYSKENEYLPQYKNFQSLIKYRKYFDDSEMTYLYDPNKKIADIFRDDIIIFEHDTVILYGNGKTKYKD